tara:strand:- start:657 stop:2186 length:1530 start_codon:yes stop_codon:yes gene_type:complete
MKTPKMKRRTFLQVMAATMPMMAGFAARVRAITAPNPHYDVIIVGAGTAGIPVAIFAARRGGRVLLLDAAPRIGGTLFLSTGQMSAAGTQLQQAKGIEDSAELHFDDVMRISQNTADAELVRLAVNEAAPTFDWLMEGGFEPFPEHPILGSAHEPYSTKRYVWSPNRGPGILQTIQHELQPLLDSGQVQVQLSSPVTALVTNQEGAIMGVRVRSEDRERVFHGSSIVLASGGYNANPALFEKLSGYRHYCNMAYPFASGAGIGLALSVGGYVRGRQNYLCNFGSILVDKDYPAKRLARFNTDPEKRKPWEIYVNTNGERFVCEDEPSVDVREHALLEQPDLRYWIVFDSAILNDSPPGVRSWSREDILTAFDEQIMFTQGDTLEALAENSGIEPIGLARTVADYNQAVLQEVDSFGRRHLPLAISKPPFYAIRLQGHSVTSTVGIGVDSELRVTRPDGSIVDNLYAAGEVLGAGQTMGRAFVGGMMVTPALSLGRYLGQNLPLPATKIP